MSLLAGIRIVDLTSVVMGPYATQIVADMGAEVIKVEPPEGDIIRQTGRGGEHRMGAMHLALNRNKRSIALNLKHPDGHSALMRLLANADALVTSMRPAALARLGLDEQALRQVNRQLVLCRGIGFGKDGPYANNPAYDDIIQSLSGFASILATGNGEPRYVPSIIADKVSGMAMAQALLGALLKRERSGGPVTIDVPMYETLVSFLMVEHLGERTFGSEGTLGYDRALSQVRRPYRTADGFICVMPYSDRHWRDFFCVAGERALASDQRFSTVSARSRNYECLYGLLAEHLRTKKTADWLEALGTVDVPCCRLNTLESLFEDPHLRATGLFQQFEHPTEGPITVVMPAACSSELVNPIRFGARRIGEDTAEVLEECGYSGDQIATLFESGAIDGFGVPAAVSFSGIAGKK